MEHEQPHSASGGGATCNTGTSLSQKDEFDKLQICEKPLFRQRLRQSGQKLADR
jgi:hypothetical protein